MNQLTSNEFANGDCTELSTMAERELAAFLGAVTEIFGSGQAELSAEDWLRDLSATETLPGSAREWRLLSVRASTQLAVRLSAQSLTVSQYL